MKRFNTLLLAALLVVSLTACKKETTPPIELFDPWAQGGTVGSDSSANPNYQGGDARDPGNVDVPAYTDNPSGASGNTGAPGSTGTEDPGGEDPGGSGTPETPGGESGGETKPSAPVVDPIQSALNGSGSTFVQTLRETEKAEDTTSRLAYRITVPMQNPTGEKGALFLGMYKSASDLSASASASPLLAEYLEGLAPTLTSALNATVCNVKETDDGAHLKASDENETYTFEVTASVRGSQSLRYARTLSALVHGNSTANFPMSDIASDISGTMGISVTADDLKLMAQLAKTRVDLRSKTCVFTDPTSGVQISVSVSDVGEVTETWNITATRNL